MIHWTFNRKADLLNDIDAGNITPGEARQLYAISPEEIEEWRRAVKRGGPKQLRQKEMALRRKL